MQRNVLLQDIQKANALLIGHKETVPDKYLFYTGDAVRLHGLSNNGLVLNGLCGSIDSYIPSTDRYLVIGVAEREKGVSVRAENIERVVSSTGMTNTDPITAVRNHFFAPGMIFEGTIQIPGEAGYVGEQYQNSRQTYKLTIMGHVYMHEVDEGDGGVSLSNSPHILARHRAYEDEQYVFIRILNAVDIESSFSIEYADGETTCHGTWDPINSCLEGSVRQTVNSVDQIFHQSDPVIHTFTLLPFHSLDTVTCKSRACQNAHISQATGDCLRAFCSLMTLKPQVAVAAKEELASLSWLDLFQMTVLEVERMCANLRYKARVLDALTFSVPSQRAQCLEQLATVAGYSRASAHEETDVSYSAVRHVTSMWLHVDPSSASANSNVRMAQYIARERLHRSYETFSDALSRAECRLTAHTWQAFRGARSSVAETSAGITGTAGVAGVAGLGADEEGTSCAICMLPLETGVETEVDVKVEVTGRAEQETETILETRNEINLNVTADGSTSHSLLLPCSHAFHDDCIQQWLHNNNKCPICRTILMEAEEEEVEEEEEGIEECVVLDDGG